MIKEYENYLQSLPTVRRKEYMLMPLAPKASVNQSRYRTKVLFYIIIKTSDIYHVHKIYDISADA